MTREDFIREYGPPEYEKAPSVLATYLENALAGLGVAILFWILFWVW